LVVLMFVPELRRYGGLSGIAYTLVVLCALTRLETSGLTRAVALLVLVLTAVKLAWELRTGAMLLVTASDVPVVAVPLAHLAGAVVGAAAFAWPRLAPRFRGRASASA
jgi:hypothetical protein